MASRTELSSWLRASQDSRLLKGLDQICIRPGFRRGRLGGSSRDELESRPRCHLAVWSAVPSQLLFSVYKADLRLWQRMGDETHRRLRAERKLGREVRRGPVPGLHVGCPRYS